MVFKLIETAKKLCKWHGIFDIIIRTGPADGMELLGAKTYTGALTIYHCVSGKLGYLQHNHLVYH